MATFEIPLTPAAQAFTIPLAGVTYAMAVQWRDDASAPGWFLDIYDSSNAPILRGVPLITGANLLEQYDYLALGFALYVETDFDPAATPTFDNLGTTSHLYAVIP